MKKSKVIKSLSVLLALLLLLQLLPKTAVVTQAQNALKLSTVSSKLHNGYKITMTIKNTTNMEVNGWTLTLNKADFKIIKIQNAKIMMSGKSIIIKPMTLSKKISAKDKISFSLTCKGTLVKNFTYELSPSKVVKIPIAPPTSMVTPTPKLTPTPTLIPTPTLTPTPMILEIATSNTTKEAIQIPTFSSLQAYTKLPDPFMFKTGSKSGTRVSNKSEWSSRRAEISALAQAYEYGVKPPKPQTVSGSFSNNTITITCTENGKTISFQCPIQYPTTGTAPYPAMIGVNMDTLNTAEILKLGVALITFPADDIGKEDNAGSRGKGKFFDLYGSNYDAGALITWAWGADRLIDALEMTPDAKIDPTKLGVTGGSRNGKGALAIGAFDERIALTVPQEAGNGGSSGWRTADAQMTAGQSVQTLSEIIGENCWFSKSLNQFSGKTMRLPFDHHEILGLCAPRGLLVIENPDFLWLGPLSGFETSTAGHMVYEALGVPNNMGYSLIGGHGHCQFPTSQQPELTAYIQKFLLGKDVDTNVFRLDKKYTFNKEKWVDWTIPTLK